MEALYGHSTPLNYTCPCQVHETDKNYFLLVIEVCDWQFVFGDQRGGLKVGQRGGRVAVMGGVTETPVGIIVSEYGPNSSHTSRVVAPLL